MPFIDELEQIKNEYQIEFDNNLFVSFLISLIARKHLLVVSSDVEESINELRRIMVNYMGMANLNILDVSQYHTSLELLRDMVNYEEKCIKQMVIITNIEDSSINIQATLLDILTKEMIILDGIEYHAREMFIVLPIVRYKLEQEYTNTYPQIFKYLLDKFWFKQVHNPEENTISSPFSDVPVNADYTVFLRMILNYRSKLQEISVVPDIKRYIYDILVFTRNHRAILGGVPTYLLKDFDLMARTICILYDYGYVIPSMVKLAARKILPLRIRVVEARHEPTLFWGSDINMVSEMLEKWTVSSVVEDVVRQVGPPI